MQTRFSAFFYHLSHTFWFLQILVGQVNKDFQFSRRFWCIAFFGQILVGTPIYTWSYQPWSGSCSLILLHWRNDIRLSLGFHLKFSRNKHYGKIYAEIIIFGSILKDSFEGFCLKICHSLYVFAQFWTDEQT